MAMRLDFLPWGERLRGGASCQPPGTVNRHLFRFQIRRLRATVNERQNTAVAGALTTTGVPFGCSLGGIGG
jgi:hypothetical protein